MTETRNQWNENYCQEHYYVDDYMTLPELNNVLGALESVLYRMQNTDSPAYKGKEYHEIWWGINQAWNAVYKLTQDSLLTKTEG
jgi:hypothetical protein